MPTSSPWHSAVQSANPTRAAYCRGVSLSTVVADAGLTEVADRIWVARHAYLDVTSTVVAGERGVVVVDALWSTRAAHVLADAVRTLGRGEPVALVNTHHHWDHVLGNGG